MVNLAIFASGRGSNAKCILEEFKCDPNIRVKLICSNRKNAGVFEYAQDYKVDTFHISKEIFQSDVSFLSLLQSHEIDIIILAGFLKLIPSFLVKAFPDKIINIHPALLPSYGGKGMYGKNVHIAVKESGDLYSGPTIHLVNEKYDEGRIIFKAARRIEPNMTAEEIGAAVLELEHEHFAKVIREYCQKIYK